MERLGIYLIIFAVASALLTFTNYQFRILAWMDDMGNGAWVIRGIMLLGGLALAFGGMQQKQQAQQTQQYR